MSNQRHAITESCPTPAHPHLPTIHPSPSPPGPQHPPPPLHAHSPPPSLGVFPAEDPICFRLCSRDDSAQRDRID
ncbi:hypothetical protein BaRGS_00003925 [Batillaria attramentaria]|uniref:Uncharacterized protein n=1 Tax=Batillaria attramentaria TaxID=370345 RepID=A0ABD0M108_9CAEN